MRKSHLSEAEVCEEGSEMRRLTPASPPRVCCRLGGALAQRVDLGPQAGGVRVFSGPPHPEWFASWCSLQKVVICTLGLCYLALSWEILPQLTSVSKELWYLWLCSLQTTFSFAGCVIAHRLF